jgi:hypothetical protein
MENPSEITRYRLMASSRPARVSGDCADALEVHVDLMSLSVETDHCPEIHVAEA